MQHMLLLNTVFTIPIVFPITTKRLTTFPLLVEKPLYCANPKATNVVCYPHCRVWKLDSLHLPKALVTLCIWNNNAAV